MLSSPSKWPLASAISLAIGVAAVALLFWQFGFNEVAAALGQVRPATLALALVTGVCVRLGYSLRWRMNATAFGVDAPLSRFIRARLAGDALGVVLPAGRIGGDPLRIALLRNEGERAAIPTAAVALDRFMEWIGNTFAALVCVSVFVWSHAAPADGAEVSLIVGMVGLLAALVAPFVMMRVGWRPFRPLHLLRPLLSSIGMRRLSALLYDTETQLIEALGEHPRVFVAGAVASLLIEGTILVEYHLLLSAFGIDLGWPTLMMVIVTGGLARAVPIPAGLGALEASEIGLLAVAAGQPTLGFVVAIVLRLHESFWSLVGFAALAGRGGVERLRFLMSAGKAPA